VKRLLPLLIWLWALPALGHHILGLPHYSYKENYPQVPTLEYPAATGPWDVLLTAYPGVPTPGEAANLSFYVKNRETSQLYDRPLQVRVLRTFTFGRNQEVLPATTVPPYDQPCKRSVTFPADGEYVVELSLEVEGQTEVIPFLVVAGEPTSTASILVALGLGMALFLVVVRAVGIKRRRAMARA